MDWWDANACCNVKLNLPLGDHPHESQGIYLRLQGWFTHRSFSTGGLGEGQRREGLEEVRSRVRLSMATDTDRVGATLPSHEVANLPQCKPQES